MKPAEYIESYKISGHYKDQLINVEESIQCILFELMRVDRIVQKAVLTAHNTYKSNDAFQGLYITAEDVDKYMSMAIGVPRWLGNGLDNACDIHDDIGTGNEYPVNFTDKSKLTDHGSRLHVLKNSFDLSDDDIDIILFCMLVEIDAKYEKIYAYLHDDITIKKMTVSLMIDLLSDSFTSGLKIRERFNSSSALIRNNLIRIECGGTESQNTFLSCHLRIDKRILDYLLGFDDLIVYSDTAPHKYIKSEYKKIKYLENIENTILNIVNDSRCREVSYVINVHCDDSKDQYQLINNISSSLGICLIKFDCNSIVKSKQFNQLVDLIIRENRLQDVLFYGCHFSVLLQDESRDMLEYIHEKLLDENIILFIDSDEDWRPTGKHVNSVVFGLPIISLEDRKTILKEELEKENIVIEKDDVSYVAQRYKMGFNQIKEAVYRAKSTLRWDAQGANACSKSVLLNACKMNTLSKIISFSSKQEAVRTLNDIVLPDDQYCQLIEIINAVKNKAIVLDEWGFGKKLSVGKSINVLFAGGSGTGKTLAAEIIATELGMDIYKIDLSSVVSKYIGETEKNITKIFDNAMSSNSILFFDEADALFGKRSEVKDAHDKYANIETGHLLQKIEEHDGVVIMTTNLRNNIDNAFVRRMYAIVEFPFPDKNSRQQIWQRLFPDEVPISQEVDYELLSKQFKLTGGNIKNIGLYAAYLSANENEKLNMIHLICATKREFQKLNKPCTEAEFGSYYEIIK